MFLLAKYGVQTAFTFPMLKRGAADLAATADWTPATGDTKVSKDGGNVANTTNNPAAVGGTGSVLWSLTLTATELSAAVVDIQIVDSATKAVEDQMIKVFTYGNASAKLAPDFSSASLALFTQQLTESYAVDGTAPTVAQALMLIQQALTEFSISGTTQTVKKLDGSTTAATLTLNSSSNPTSLTRAS
jgi:hypothetical protein